MLKILQRKQEVKVITHINIATAGEINYALGLNDIRNPLVCGYLEMYEGTRACEKVTLPVNLNSNTTIDITVQRYNRMINRRHNLRDDKILSLNWRLKFRLIVKFALVTL